MRNISEKLFNVSLSKISDSNLQTEDDYDYYYEKTINKNTVIQTAHPNAADFYIGLYIPKTNETYTSGKTTTLGASNIDKSWMYILEQEDSPISITYTFHIEQA